MSGQRAGTADRSPGSGRFNAPHRAAAPPAQRRAEGAAREQRPADDRYAGDEPAAGGRAANRRAGGRGPRPAEPQGGKGGRTALFALGLPVLGAVADELIGSGIGTVFAVCAVLGTGLAALVSSRPGWWWVATAPPIVVLVVTAGAEMLVHGDKYQGKALATGAAGWAIHGFPVMASAVGAALLVVVVRIAKDGRGRRG